MMKRTILIDSVNCPGSLTDAVVHANGPLYVEIDRAGARIGRAGKPLGMQIGTSRVANDRLLIIENIVPASIADR
jgi:hypothetical protein